jgi:hypothetical protein
MTEARYLPQHATTVDAEQSACLAVSAKGARPSPAAENVIKHVEKRRGPNLARPLPCDTSSARPRESRQSARG